jgi:hypothetical protein
VKRCLDRGAREAREEAREEERAARHAGATRTTSFSGCEPKTSPHQLPSTHASSRHVHTSVSQSVSFVAFPPRAHRLKGRRPLPSVNTSTRTEYSLARATAYTSLPALERELEDSEVFSLRKRTDSDARASAYYMYMYTRKFCISQRREYHIFTRNHVQ